MLGGIRHLVWDFGTGLGKGTRDTMAWANIIGSAGLTVVLWAIGLAVR
jgi:succinate dehydrogenase / fumarate reductase cytochrome b subunit